MPREPAAKKPPHHSAKRSRSEMAQAILDKHEHIRDAVHKVLRDAGLRELRLHSVRFSAAGGSLADSNCDPPCAADEDCVLDSNGAEVRWVCVPRPRRG